MVGSVSYSRPRVDMLTLGAGVLRGVVWWGGGVSYSRPRVDMLTLGAGVLRGVVWWGRSLTADLGWTC